ncbi:hypothetical protein [Paraburkholderia flagellata]|uniref:hypothetical protein n=1 Tax=Paraburkholderia flagellata TaxID=2883241 RepID=UPI001F2EB51E|nr:hypothetical protein [Paraburkholderia flagellata]
MRGAGRAFVPSLAASLALSASEAPTSGSTSMPAQAQWVFVVILLFVFKYGTFHLNIQSATQEGSLIAQIRATMWVTVFVFA